MMQLLDQATLRIHLKVSDLGIHPANQLAREEF